MMVPWLRHGAAGWLIGALILSASRSSAQAGPTDSLKAWAMLGHDPQRTAQGTGLGPLHPSPPRLVLSTARQKWGTE